MKQQNRWQSLDLAHPLLFALLLALIVGLVVGAYDVPVQAAGNTLTLDNVTAAAGASGSFAITLDNSDAVASGQVRFTYAASLGLTITGVQVTNRTAGFTSTGSAYNTGNASLSGYQVLFYNLSNLTIAPGTGAILTISYTLAANASGNTTLPFTQAILASAAAQALPVTTVDGSFTVRQAPTATSTATATPTSSATSTPTATATATETPTATPTLTPTPIADTVTPTATSTAIAPGTDTPTPTLVAGATATAIPPTSTATVTAEPTSASSTPTPVASLPAQIYLPLIQR